MLNPSSDIYDVIQCPTMLTSKRSDPAPYASFGTKELDRECNIEDICDFVVEYIHSDVLVSIRRPDAGHYLILFQGLLSDRHLVIAGTPVVSAYIFFLEIISTDQSKVPYELPYFLITDSYCRMVYKTKIAYIWPNFVHRLWTTQKTAYLWILTVMTCRAL